MPPAPPVTQRPGDLARAASAGAGLPGGALTRVEDTPDVGLVLVAARAIKADQSVLAETPVITAPNIDPRHVDGPGTNPLYAWLRADQASRTAALELFCCEPVDHPGLLGERLLVRQTRQQDPARFAAFSDEELVRFLGALRFNGQECADGRQGLFARASKAAHSCRPNISFEMVDGSPDSIEFLALRPISRGERLSISYLSPEVLLQARAQRQAKLTRRLFSWRLS